MVIFMVLNNFKNPSDDAIYIPPNHSKPLSKINFIQPYWLGGGAKTILCPCVRKCNNNIKLKKMSDEIVKILLNSKLTRRGSYLQSSSIFLTCCN